MMDFFNRKALQGERLKRSNAEHRASQAEKAEETARRELDDIRKSIVVAKCSFCCKSQHEVRKLIAGPTVFICDECVLTSVDVLLGEKAGAVA